MKLMNEVINSIEDENLKKFAIGLQNKLGIAKNAIIEKIRRGEKVIRAEESALKTSTFAYAEKNRGKILQKVAAGLAAVMLVGMLASCDDGLVGELFSPTSGDGYDTLESDDYVDEGDQTSYFDENANIIKYDKLEVDDQVLVDPLPAIEYGLHFMEIFNYKDIMTTESDFASFLLVYDNAMNGQADFLLSVDNLDIMAILKISHPNIIRENISITSSNEWAGWKHKIISTNYNFALESTDCDGNVYLTGFVNGRLENDLGFINEDTIEIMREVAKKYSYNDIVNRVRLKFFTEAYRLKQESDDFNFISNVSSVEEDGKEIHPSQYHYIIEYIRIKPEDSTHSFYLNFDYNISEDYFDQLLASGKVVGYVPKTE